MGSRPRRTVRHGTATGKTLSDAERRSDGYGRHLDPMVYDHQAAEYPVSPSAIPSFFNGPIRYFAIQ